MKYLEIVQIWIPQTWGVRSKHLTKGGQKASRVIKSIPYVDERCPGPRPWKIEGSIKTTISSSCPEICLLWPNCWQYVAKGQNELGAIKGQHNAWLGSRLQGWGKKVEVGLRFHVTSSTKMSMSLVITREGETCYKILLSWLSTISMLEVFSCQGNSIPQLQKH